MNIHEIFKWQTLIGALIGAGTPLTFWFFTNWYQKRQDYKDSLVLLEKILVLNLNTAINNKDTTLHFIKTKLLPLITLIEDRIEHGAYSTEVAYFPLFSTPSSEGLLKIKLKSNFIANEVLRTALLTNDFAFAIGDIREQFKNVIEINREMGFMKLNPPDVHNLQYKENIIEFKRVLEEDILENNIKIYIKRVVSTLVPLQTYIKMGDFRWQLKFSQKYKFFKSKKTLQAFIEKSPERLEGYFKEQVDARILKIN